MKTTLMKCDCVNVQYKEASLYGEVISFLSQSLPLSLDNRAKCFQVA